MATLELKEVLEFGWIDRYWWDLRARELGGREGKLWTTGESILLHIKQFVYGNDVVDETFG